MILNRPGQPPSNLQTPDLATVMRPVPEYNALLEKAQRNNPQLRALQEQVAASEERVKMARAGNRPTLIGEAEASAYSRELGSNDPLRIGVVLTIPLYTSGAVDASIGQEQARLYRSQAELRAVEDEIRQSVLLLWQELEQLRIEAEEAQAQMAYRELYLDRSRANYEMEVSTDLGDAMVLLTEAQLAQARVQFQTALAWERLNGLTGDTAANLPSQH
jgi:outer membrane protein TolC